MRRFAAARQAAFETEMGILAEFEFALTEGRDPPPRRLRTEPEPKPARVRKMTPERRRIIERDWPAGVPNAVILDRINALPGEKYTAQQLSVVASGWLGLYRPKGFPGTQPASGGVICAPAAQVAESAPPAPPPRVAAPETPEKCGSQIVVDIATAQAWGAQRGLGPFADIETIQRKRDALGQPRFVMRDCRVFA